MSDTSSEARGSRLSRKAGKRGGRAPRPVAALLARYPRDVQSLARQTRILVRESLPEIAEVVDVPARLIGYSYGPGYRGVVCTLILGQSGLKLGFYLGAALPDPARLLEGSGKVHRHVKVRAASDLQPTALRSLLKVAGAAAKERTKPGLG